MRLRICEIVETAKDAYAVEFDGPAEILSNLLRAQPAIFKKSRSEGSGQ